MYGLLQLGILLHAERDTRGMGGGASICERYECLLLSKEMCAPRFPVSAWAPSESQGRGREKTQGIGGGLNKEKIQGAKQGLFQEMSQWRHNSSRRRI